eukprot:2088852-Alexandrium_andersonii.AAC.1
MPLLLVGALWLPSSSTALPLFRTLALLPMPDRVLVRATLDWWTQRAAQLQPSPSHIVPRAIRHRCPVPRQYAPLPEREWAAELRRPLCSSEHLCCSPA